MNESTDNQDELFEYYREKFDKFEEWISTQPHIPKNIPRAILLRYFKVCRFNLEASKKLLDINVKFRIKNQYLFTDRDIESEEFRKVVGTVQFTRFPKLTKEGYNIESFRIINPALENFIFKDIVKLVFMSNDVNSLIRPNVNGVVVIQDASGFTFQHFLKIVSNTQTALLFAQYAQEANCMDMKQVHYINCSKIIARAYSFFKPFLSKELIDKNFFHSSGYEALHEFIPKEYLPIEFGGTEGTLDEYHENTLREMHKYRDFLMKDENFFLLK